MTTIKVLQHKRIVLGVTGGIAAYKAAAVCSRLVQAGAVVDVVMTEAAQKFITPLTFQALTHRPVYTDMFQIPPGENIPHIPEYTCSNPVSAGHGDGYVAAWSNPA
jgi:phosphopantothenoylcysteine decarboxylase/phosphopantothenate--cysteine ligase